MGFALHALQNALGPRYVAGWRKDNKLLRIRVCTTGSLQISIFFQSFQVDEDSALN